MLIRLIALALAALSATPIGSWRGTVETGHGANALTLVIDTAATGYAGSYELELMGQNIGGPIDALAVRGDSVSFELGFDTQNGRATFTFQGRQVGARMNGRFAGYLGGTEMSTGAWSAARAP